MSCKIIFEKNFSFKKLCYISYRRYKTHLSEGNFKILSNSKRTINHKNINYPKGAYP